MIDSAMNTLVYVTWQGATHAVPAMAHDNDEGTYITIFRNHFPPYFGSEDKRIGEINFQFGHRCLARQVSGDLSFVCTELIDLDKFE